MMYDLLMNWNVKKSSLFCLIIFLFLGYVGSVKADHNQYLFDQANKHFQQNEYQQAIETYLEIISNGYESWQLYYNLGNAYYKVKQVGRAIVNYERALKLNPKNEDILFNLDIANLSVVDKIVTPPQFIIIKFLSDLKSLWDIQTLTFLAIGVYLLITLLVIVKIFIRNSRFQRLINMILIAVMTLFLIVSIIFIIRIHENNTFQYAIVLEQKVDVLSSPDSEATELFSLHEGVKLKVEEFRDDWAKIRLADRKVGWVKRDAFEII